LLPFGVNIHLSTRATEGIKGVTNKQGTLTGYPEKGLQKIHTHTRKEKARKKNLEAAVMVPGK